MVLSLVNIDRLPIKNYGVYNLPEAFCVGIVAILLTTFLPTCPFLEPSLRILFFLLGISVHGIVSRLTQWIDANQRRILDYWPTLRTYDLNIVPIQGNYVIALKKHVEP